MEGKKHGKGQAGVIGQAGFARRDSTCGTRPVVHCRWLRDEVKVERAGGKGQGQDMWYRLERKGRDGADHAC
jgi:hypothetical protein